MALIDTLRLTVGDSYGGGLLQVREPNLSEFLSYRIDEGSEITVTVSTDDWKPKQLDVCIGSFDGQSLAFVALATKAGRVATRIDRIRLSHIQSFDAVNIQDLASMLGGRYVNLFQTVVTRGSSRVPPKTWMALLEALVKLRPELSDVLVELHNSTKITQVQYRSRAYEVIADERDAIGVAMSAFGRDRSDLFGAWKEPDNSSSFLDGIDRTELREDIMVFNDAGVFEDWIPSAGAAKGVVHMTSLDGQDQLDIVIANRTRIEHTLGVDLIYYHNYYDSFVMVQYKRMDKPDSGKEWVYRPEKTFDAEIKRMQSFGGGGRKKKSPLSSTPTKNYRLNPDGFYFKFCPRTDFEPGSNSLIQGMYLPAEYVDQLLKSSSGKGPRGGRLISYEIAERWATNTFFTQLIREGWIGTRGVGSERIKEIIRQSLDTGRATVVARSSPTVYSRT